MRKFPITIHQTILAIDEELGKTKNYSGYRYRLASAAYELRILEEWMQKNKEANYVHLPSKNRQ